MTKMLQEFMSILDLQINFISVKNTKIVSLFLSEIFFKR